MPTVTMTLQVPIELKDAFMQAVQQEQKPASSVLLDLMRYFVSEAEEKQTPLYRANEAIAAGDISKAVSIMKEEPLPPDLANVFKDSLGIDFVLQSGFDLSKVEEKYGNEWFSK